jgi:hypothetical protein
MGDLVEVARFYDPEEAYCAKSFLNAHGISTFVGNDHYLTAAPWMRFALNGYGIHVAASDARDAQDLLRTIQASKPENAETTVEESEISDRMQRSRNKNWPWFPVAFFIGIPFLPKERSGWFVAVQYAALLSLYALAFYSLYNWVLWFSTEL